GVRVGADGHRSAQPGGGLRAGQGVQDLVGGRHGNHSTPCHRVKVKVRLLRAVPCSPATSRPGQGVHVPGRVCRPGAGGQEATVPYRLAARAFALAASTSRSFGGAVVVRSASRCSVMWAMSATACSKVSLFACDGLFIPLTLRTYCSAAACTSSEVACGSKLYRVRMLRHMVPSSPLRRPSTRARALRLPPDPAPRCRCDRVASP